jgi:translation elongation factor EF-1beta
MDLPNLLSKISTNSNQQVFLAIEISRGVIKSAAWSVDANSASIVSYGMAKPWSIDTENESLLTAIDESISSALAPISQEINQVIFGLPELWINEDSITEKHKSILKFICQKLALKPIGFVSTAEAIVNHFRDLEGGPLSCVLVNIGSKEILVNLVKLGVIDETQVVGRSAMITSDVEEALARFPQGETLPARMILYDGDSDLESLKQDLIAYDWTAHLPFLHIPKVEVLEESYTVKAVALSGGAEVAKSMGLLGTPAVAAPKSAAPSPKPSSSETSSLDKKFAQEMGFKTTQTSVKPTAQAPQEDEELQSEEHDNLMPVAQVAHTTPQAVTTRQKSLPKFSLPRFTLPRLGRSGHNSGNASSKKKVAIIALIILIGALLGGGAYAYYSLPTAELNVYFSLEPLQKELSFELDTQVTALDVTGGKVPATKQVIEVSQTAEKLTSGTKTIGERAKGTITLANYTNAAKSFPKGTVIRVNAIQFTLNDDVSVASSSSQVDANLQLNIKPGETEAAVTAAAIGKESNVPKDTVFRVANFSETDYLAKAKTDISGGSSQQVQVVAESDIETLKEELAETLTKDAQAKAQEQGEGQAAVVDENIEVLSEEASVSVGEEADSLSITMTASKNAYLYKLNDVTLLAQEQLQQAVPENFVVRPNATQVSVLESTIDEAGGIMVKAMVTLQLFPKLDADSIKNSIVGQKPDALEEKFKPLPRYVKHELMQSPQLPAFANTLPRKAENITLKLKSNLQ